MKMEQEVESKIIEFSMLEEENKRLEQQHQLIEQQLFSLQSLKDDLEEISKHKGEILSNLGSGIFVKSQLADSKKILVNVGVGVVVEKNFEDGKKIIERQVKKVDYLREEIEKLKMKNTDSMIQLEGELRKIAGKK